MQCSLSDDLIASRAPNYIGQPGWPGRSIIFLVVFWLLIQGGHGFCAVSGGIDDRYPLEPPDTSSPRATTAGFLETMEHATNVFDRLMLQYRQETGLFPSRPVLDQVAELKRLLRHARQYLDLSETPPAIRETVGWQTVALLKEIFDRIEIPPITAIPDEAVMRESERSRWSFPHTEIVIAKVDDEAGDGKYLFSPDTVERAMRFYERVRHLPYKAGSWEGVYEFLSQYSVFVPPKLIDLLPEWARTRSGGLTVWQWLSIAVMLATVAIGLTLIYRWGYRHPERRPEERPHRRILFPISLMLAASLLDVVLTRIRISGHVYVQLATALDIIFFVAAGWAVILVGNVVTAHLLASRRLRVRRIDAAMVRIGSRLLFFAIAILLLLEGARTLGVPVVPLLAGLGIGGLALALAAQSTIENFLAGLTLYIDRPVGVGDFCRFGDKIGTIEEIGIRSTRVRTLEDTVLTVPNAEFAKQHLDNYSKRGKYWYHPRISLRCETTPSQIRYLLHEIHQLLQDHPLVVHDSARIRFAGFGAYSLDLEVFSYVTASDYETFLQIAEEFHLAIMKLVEQAGSTLAIPTSREYEIKEQADNEYRVQRAREVDALVRRWEEHSGPA